MQAMRYYLAIILIAVGGFWPDGVAAEKRVALVIGNGGYKETTPLINTVHDAPDMAAALRRLGFDVLDGLDLDKRGMERMIRQFDQKLPGADIALFFYAGHGMQVSGQNYLVPIDARLAAEGDIDFESLPLMLVLARMERESKTSIVLLDACRDNPLARNLARTMGTRAANVGQGLAEIRTGVGTLIGFSTQPGNVALDGRGRNSPYTAALLKQIETPGRDVMSTLAAVTGEVVKVTSGKQVPWQHASLTGPVVLQSTGEVATSAAVPLPPPVQLPLPVIAAPQPSAAGETWPLIKDTTSVSALESYIRRYGDTFYGDLARERLALLQAQMRIATAKQQDDAARLETERVARLKIEEDQRTAPPQANPAVIQPGDAITLARSIQTELKRVGCHTGAADGNWGAKSRTAASEFALRIRVGTLGDEPSMDLLKRLLDQRSRVCPLSCDDDEIESGGRCIARPAAAPPRQVRRPEPDPQEKPRARVKETPAHAKEADSSRCSSYDRCASTSGASSERPGQRYSTVLRVCGVRPTGC